MKTETLNTKRQRNVYLVLMYQHTKNQKYFNLLMEENEKLILFSCSYLMKALGEKYRDDIFQESMIGFFEAVKKFDVCRSGNFAAVAVLYIKSQLQDFSKNNINQQTQNMEPYLLCSMFEASVKSPETLFRQYELTDILDKEIFNIIGNDPYKEEMLYHFKNNSNVDLYNQSGESRQALDFKRRWLCQKIRNNINPELSPSIQFEISNSFDLPFDRSVYCVPKRRKSKSENKEV